MSKTPLRADTSKAPVEAGAARGPAAEASSAETAQYIAEFAAELSYLARRSNLDLLAYLLDMARLEATRVRQGSGRKP